MRICPYLLASPNATAKTDRTGRIDFLNKEDATIGALPKMTTYKAIAWR
jgi:hypothetical protein